jgi:hypothetical protein
MIYEIDFEHWEDAYAPYLLDRYGRRGLPGVWDFGEDESEEEYLRNVQDKYGKWAHALLRARCEAAGLEIAPMDSPGEDFVTPCDILDTWDGEEYKILLKNKDDVYELLMIIGQALHEHGVDSERHNEQGLVDRETRDAMFKAMVTDNFFGVLYPTVEDFLLEY